MRRSEAGKLLKPRCLLSGPIAGDIWGRRRQTDVGRRVLTSACSRVPWFLAAHSLNMHPTHLDLAALPFTYRSVSQTYAGRIPPLPAFQHAEEAAGLEPDQF